MDDKKRRNFVMNEKLQYASMLEIPVSTCNVTYKPIKKRRFGRKKSAATEDVKKELLKKVNAISEVESFPSAPEKTAAEEVAETLTENVASMDERGEVAESDKIVTASVMPVKSKKEKRKVRISAVAVELAVIGVLLAVIFLTSAFYPQSGINAFMKGVFGTEKISSEIDDRTYEQFSPVITVAAGETLVVEDGAVSVAGKGSVYTPVGGKVKRITVDGNGKYEMEIAHSENFTTVISGIDYAYAATGDTVYGNIPVGYVKDGGYKMCFAGENGAVITGYELSGNTVVWAV